MLKKIVGKDFLTRNEIILRKMYALFYSGTNFKCTVCDKRLRKFIGVFEHDLLCPNCGSLSRTRRLQCILDELILNRTVKILDFSPHRCMYRKLKKNKQIKYVSTDYAGEFIADKKLDIVAIDEPDNTYDVIICYHILEHIQNDTQAISELFRIMKPGGKGIIQTPFKEGGIYENDSIQTDKERKIHFGLEDHVRIYSVSGLCERLKDAGFTVSPVRFREKQPDFYGLIDETVIFVEKNG